MALHNYLRACESAKYCPPGFVDGEDGVGNPINGGCRTDDEPNTRLQDVAQTSSDIINIIYSSFIIPSFHSLKAFWECSSHKNICSTAGQVQWQWNHIKCYIIQLQTKYRILLRIGLEHIWRHKMFWWKLNFIKNLLDSQLCQGPLPWCHFI